MSKFDRNITIEMINSAFVGRSRPSILEGSKSLLDFERKDLYDYCVASYEELTSDLIEEKYEALSWMSPESFVFYLPWILRFSIEHDDARSMSIGSILSMLDRGTNTDNWESFFFDRWALLSLQELKAVEHWLLWVSEKIEDDAVNRAFDVIQVLKNMKLASLD